MWLVCQIFNPSSYSRLCQALTIPQGEKYFSSIDSGYDGTLCDKFSSGLTDEDELVSSSHYAMAPSSLQKNADKKRTGDRYVKEAWHPSASLIVRLFGGLRYNNSFPANTDG